MAHHRLKGLFRMESVSNQKYHSLSIKLNGLSAVLFLSFFIISKLGIVRIFIDLSFSLNESYCQKCAWLQCRRCIEAFKFIVSLHELAWFL